MKVLFVHGACVVDGSWWWSRMAQPLAEHGLRTGAVELPSCAALTDQGMLGDLAADVAAVRQAAHGDEPVVLVGHSYGGMVISAASAGLAVVRHLVYVASMLPEPGESLAAIAGPGSQSWLEPENEGGNTVRLRADLSEQGFVAHFLADCDQAAVEGALARIGRQSAAVFGQSPASVGWPEVPSTAVVCTEDRATAPDRQFEWSKRAAAVVELASGHHPFLSQPSQLAEIIAERAAG
jgi:pimeloyl-ACP methyl ester carboxylesterase